MCGIFGFAVKDSPQLDFELFKQDLAGLYRLSAQRGRDSAGLVTYANEKYRIFQRAIDPLQFIELAGFDQILNDTLGAQRATGPFACINHCRLVTDGSASVADNNQPVYAGSFIGVHNGIITNAAQIQPGPAAKPAANSEGTAAPNDTRVLFDYMSGQYAQTRDLAAVLAAVQANLEGSFSIAAFLDHKQELVLATNTGSLYFALNAQNNILCFASESYFLKQFLAASQTFQANTGAIQHVPAGHYLRLSFDFQIFEQAPIPRQPKTSSAQRTPAAGRADGPAFAVEFYRSSVQTLRRCTKCILPHTYPFVEFDRDGVCSFCRNHAHQKLKGEDALRQRLDRFRSKDGSPDCLVGLSGGRDSCYGLHILKTTYGMHPIAYTFDWGLTTDVSRRNQAKVCGKLGIEHIIRSPDILKKRRFVRKNIHAWLKQPQLGMVPLFQAGDKEFYHFGRALQKELKLDLTVLCSGHQLEHREFMVGFTGINHKPLRENHDFQLHPLSNKIRLAAWYCLQYIKNPAYINESFFDSIRSYIISFLVTADFLYLFHYLAWEENEINRVLNAEYAWESDQRFGQTQWRMGDGQTAFNNYIYYQIAGFTEFDAFRSNQIREGLLDRAAALQLVESDNQPKFESIEYFSRLIGLNLDEVLRKIDNIPKLY